MTTTTAAPAAGSTGTSSGSLRTYLITRLLLVIPMVWILVTLVFFVMRVVGDPIEAAFGGKVTAADLANRRHQAGPGPADPDQYWDYLKGVAHFDFGTTITDHQKISTLDHSARRGDAGTDVSTPSSSRCSSAFRSAASRRATATASRTSSIRLFAVLAYAMPVFFLGLLFKLLFAVKLGWLPANSQASPDVDIVLSTTSRRTRTSTCSTRSSTATRATSGTSSSTPCCPR